MATDLEQRIIDFVSRETSERPERISLDTTLLDDLGVDGDDGWELMEHFASTFSVDMRTYVQSKFFAGEGLSIECLVSGIRGMIQAFQGKRDRQRIEFEQITIRDLVEAADRGRWLK